MAPGASSWSVPSTGLPRLLLQLDMPGEIELPDGSVFPTGSGSPAFRVIFRSKKALKTPMTEMAVGRAFVKGDIDVEGDLDMLFDAKNKLQDKMPLRQKLQFAWDSLRTTTGMNARAIESHYGRDDSFFLTFLDKRFRLYSHGLFKSPTESIEAAAQNKMEAEEDGGGLTEYCAPRGVHVTTLTIAANGGVFIRKLISDNKLLGEVLLEDYFDHCPKEPYDHAVSLGSIEHMPDYTRFARKMWSMLKPGGRLYLDGAAAVEKYAVGSFTRDYIWSGTHTYMAVQDVVAELLYHGFALPRLQGETQDYHLMILEWARRLDQAKDAVIAGWGEQTYRVFRLMMWGGEHAFKANDLQAYHLVVQKTESPGPRPSSIRRFLRGLYY
ncbi:hypothetical protein E4U42_004007 [Claviceps africana]|uniref:S-adenosyl-L-methionine-dependent methyltransferase n=1 Tax=Claviceps africana TaxID=83212 RepID=A0A8K0NL47_9HYPO|nr:hypothetical protein E4U42_004007 [Claviceps africana]